MQQKERLRGMVNFEVEQNKDSGCREMKRQDRRNNRRGNVKQDRYCSRKVRMDGSTLQL